MCKHFPPTLSYRRSDGGCFIGDICDTFEASKYECRSLIRSRCVLWWLFMVFAWSIPDLVMRGPLGTSPALRRIVLIASRER